ncbi:MAG TPA: hypothetical protein PLS50_06920 [Candidatus Dojkabacteria bacterium]|nr:hypothetical protein [Candidatus Dojkabacteria bacterium]
MNALNFEQCKEIFMYNMEYLDSISISKMSDGELLAVITFRKKDQDFEVKKFFFGKTLTILNEKINEFMNNEIKL